MQPLRWVLCLWYLLMGVASCWGLVLMARSHATPGSVLISLVILSGALGTLVALWRGSSWAMAAATLAALPQIVAFSTMVDHGKLGSSHDYWAGSPGAFVVAWSRDSSRFILPVENLGPTFQMGWAYWAGIDMPASSARPRWLGVNLVAIAPLIIVGAYERRRRNPANTSN